MGKIFISDCLLFLHDGARLFGVSVRLDENESGVLDHFVEVFFFVNY